MSKISIYEVVPVPKLADKLVGTSVGGEPEDLTYNFTLGELLNLFIPNIPGNTLQGVLDFGNTATQNINLTGIITTTTLNVGSTANILNSNLTGQTKITGGLYDRLNSIGTAGQVLRSTGTQVEWYSIPNVIPTLQQVLASGNTADINVILTSNIQALTATANNVVSNTSLSVNGTLKDKDASVGTAGQLLSSTGTKVQWVDLPVYTATSPLSINSITRNISIQQASSTQNGYLSSADWITFDGKQGAVSLTTVGSSGPATLVGSVINVPNYTLSGLGGVPQTRTLTINGVTYNLSADRSWTLATGVSSVSATTPLFSTGGPNPDISIQQSSSSLNGYLSSADWLMFNNKQPAGNYITSLTGEATGAGPGATAVTLSNAAVIGKLLTGLNITGSTISSSDSILTAFGKVQNQINSLVGGVQYQGVWNAATNTPALVSSVGTQGYYYIVSVAGNTNLNGITDWQVGDWAIFNGSTWNKVDNTDLVTSVNGQVGAVSLTTDNIPEGATNLYYLDSRARAALSFAAGSGAYNSTTGVITIPTDNSQILNGAGYITLASLSATSPLSYNNLTGAFSIQVANTTQNGYLSSTDWNTFNGKQNYLNGTGLVKSVAGTISYITDNSANWNTAYNDSIISAAVTGTATKTLTLNQQDGGTITASWSDIDTGLTSVGVSMPAAFSVTNSPLTSNGTIAVTGAGTTLQYIDGTGALQNFPGLTGYVPYTGANQNVDLGEYGISAGYFQADLTPTGALQVGRMQWNSTDGTMDLRLMGNNVTLQVGQENVSRVVNKSGVNLLEANYQVVRIRKVAEGGAQGQRLAVVLAQGNNENNSTEVLGLVTETINVNQEGFITAFGEVKEINTTGSLQGETWVDGDILYVSTSVAGQLTNIRPVAPNHAVTVGYVTYAHANHGKIYMAIDTGYELGELHNVYAPSPTANQSIYWDTTNSRYQLNTIGGILGYTPANAATTISTTAPLQGGGDLSANRTFSITQSGAASDGYLSSTDWNTFNNKQPAGSYVPTSRLLSINGTQYDLSADRSWSVGTVTSVAALTLGTSGTDLSSSVANGTTTPVITLNVPTASAANRGALSAADWSTFNTKVGGVTASSPLASSGGQTPNITIQQASGSQNGYLSSTDWTTFNNKQAAGNYITSLTGEATATGPGAASVTLNNASVTGKVLTGVNITGGSISATDSILTAFGKVQNQINGLVGGSIYQGTWNAATNTPVLASGVGTKGYYYIVSVAGTTNLDGITDWFVGDWAIFDGTAWQQVDNTDAVVSVNGQTGAVSLTTDNIPEGATNQYFLNSRARAALSFAAGSGAYNSTTGVITIPTNNNQITNGANYITLASLSGTAPIVYSNTTGAISITQAGTASNGYLSSTDWNTFNNKQPSGNYVPYTGANANVDLGAYFLKTSKVYKTYDWLQEKDFGYVGGWKTLAIGSLTSANNFSLAFAVDLSGNTGSSFTGNGNEYFWRNSGSFKTPNAANTEYNTLFSWNTAGGLTFNQSAEFLSTLTVGSPLSVKSTTPYIQWINASSTRLAYIQHNATNFIYSADTGIHIFNQSATITDTLRVISSAYPSAYNTSLRSDSSAVGILQLGNNNDNYILAGNTNTGGYLIFRVNCTTESITSGTEALRLNANTTASFSSRVNVNGAADDGDIALQALAPSGAGKYIFVGRDSSSQWRFSVSSSGDTQIGVPQSGSTYKLLTLSSSGNNLDTGTVLRLIANSALDLVDISVSDTKTRIYHQENAADAAGGYGIIQLRTNAVANSSFPTRGGFQFTINTTDVLFINSLGQATLNSGANSSLMFLGDVANTTASFFEPQNGGKTSYFGRENSAGNWVFATAVTPYSTVIAAYNTTAPIILGHTNAEVTIANGGATTFSNLAGTGTRMVVADANGLLSTQSVPTGTITGSGTTNYVSKWTSGTAIGDSLIYDDGTYVGVNTTTNNGAKFVIKGVNGVPATTGTTTTAVLRLSSGTGLYNVLDFGTNESLDYSWIQSTRANSLGTYDKLLIQPNGGSVVIGGTATGGYKLYVDGTVGVTGAATFSSSVTTGGNINANSASAVLQVNSYAVAKYSYFGYSTGYPGVIIGGAGFQSLFFNVDVSGNPGSSFTGNGSEYIWRNAGSFKTPNSINTEYNTLLSWNSSGQVTIPGATTIGSLTTASLQIGDYTGSPTLTFAAASNGLSKINFYDANTTEGLYLRTDGEQYGGTMTFGARWDDDEAKIVFKMYQVSAGATYNARVGIGTTAPNSTLHVIGDNGSSASAILRLRDTNSTSRTTRLQFEDYNGTLADGLIDFKIGTAGVASSATLSIGIGSAGLTFNNTNVATFSSSVHIPSSSSSGQGYYYFDYLSSAAASRTWRLAGDYNAYGDFVLQQSTTQTGSTFSNILRFEPTGAATFSSTLEATNIGIGNAPTGTKLFANQATAGEWIATFKNYGTTNAYGVSIDMSGSTSTQSAFQVYTVAGNGIRVLNSNGGLLVGTFTDISGKLVVKQPYTSATTPIWFGNTSYTAWNRYAYDTMVLQQDDVTSFRMVEKNGEANSSDQILCFSIGDNSATIATSAQPLKFFVNGSPTGITYQGLSGTEVLRLNTNGNAQFYGELGITSTVSAGGSFISTVGGTAEVRLRGGGYGGSYNTSLRSIAGATGILQFGNNGDNFVLIGNTAYSASTALYFRINTTTESTTGGSEILRLNNNLSAQFASSLTAASFFESSDSRIKTLIKDDYKVLGIESIKARLYFKDGKEEVGYYAQDFQSILPSAVTEGKDGILSLSYTQVHTAKISIIEDEVTILKRRVAELESKLN